VQRTSSPPSDERFPFANGHATFHREAGLLRVVEEGDPGSAEEMERYFAAIDRVLAVTGAKSLLIAAAKQVPNPLAPHWKAIREARWRCLAGSRADRIAVLVDEELAVARVQMSAVAFRAPVRAFLSEDEARAWLRSPR
jgi:hypothetical protein